MDAIVPQATQLRASDCAAQPYHTHVRQLMEANRRVAASGAIYTVPSPELYPFQWLWDSCFHAIIFSHFDIDAAKDELRAACSAPLPSGMLPHILYHSADGEHAGTNWGREMRGDIINASWGTDGTSSITQPPLMAEAAWRVHEAAGGGEDTFLLELYPTLQNHFLYLARERTRAPYTPLLAIINPDESGEDNSPRFDQALGLPPMHTAEEHLTVRIELNRKYARCDFSVGRCMDEHFGIIDVPFNIIYAEGLDYLGKIAGTIGESKAARNWQKRAREVRAALREQCVIGGLFRSIDARVGEHILLDTWANFMPLYGGLLSQAEAEALVWSLHDERRFGTRFLVPSTSASEAAFDPVSGFWRGPVWMAPNWFLYRGLLRYGFREEALRVRQSSCALVAQSGFREHYHPENGGGLGSHEFTWAGLVIDME